MLKNLTTVRKVGLGFAVLTLILSLAVGLTLIQVSRTQALTNQLVNVQAPLSDASLRILNGVNYSLAGLRGWMLLGNERFKVERADAWSDEIEPALKSLKEQSAAAGNATWIQQVKTAETALTSLKTFQQQIEELANSPGNLPATAMLTSEAAPQASVVTQAITSMIDTESALEATSERRALLVAMANFRGSFALGLASIRACLLSGDNEFADEFRRHWKINQQAFDTIESQSALLMGQQVADWKLLKTSLTSFEPLPEKMFAVRASADWNLANSSLRDDAAPLALTIQAALSQILDELGPQVAANRDRVVELTAFLVTLQWILLASGLLFSGCVATVIIRAVKNSISSVLAATQQMAAASAEIATAAQQQVTSLNETASSLNEITTTSEEFKATMQEFADRARAVQEAADETAKLTDDGRVLTQDSSSRIGQVRTNSQSAGESVLNLAEQMQRIGEITASVNEIAEQTKLLALNASIEAARAGEEGRGFAVVATQVRELANQSKESAGRIEGLITETQRSMQDVVTRIEDGARLSDEASQIVNRMTRSFDEIAQAIEQTTEAMSQINTGARQQEQGISELVSSITEIDSASKESLTSAEQTRKSIQSIDTEMQRLTDVMKAF